MHDHHHRRRAFKNIAPPAGLWRHRRRARRTQRGRGRTGIQPNAGAASRGEAHASMLVIHTRSSMRLRPCLPACVHACIRMHPLAHAHPCACGRSAVVFADAATHACVS
eukprot:351282-Chlamydomonas_euryale.AAC.4